MAYTNIGFNYYFSKYYSENIIGDEGIPINDDLIQLNNLTIQPVISGNSLNIYLFQKPNKID